MRASFLVAKPFFIASFRGGQRVRELPGFPKRDWPHHGGFTLKTWLSPKGPFLIPSHWRVKASIYQLERGGGRGDTVHCRDRHNTQLYFPFGVSSSFPHELRQFNATTYKLRIQLCSVVWLKAVAWKSLSDPRNSSKEGREEPEHTEIFSGENQPTNKNVVRHQKSTANHKTQIFWLMISVLLCVWEDARVRSPRNHSYDMHLNCLDPVSYIFLSWISLRVHRWGVATAVEDHNSLCLLAFFVHMIQVIWGQSQFNF